MGAEKYLEIAAKYGLPSMLLVAITIVAYRFLHYSLWPFIVDYFKKTQETQVAQYVEVKKESQELLRKQLEEMQTARKVDQEWMRERDAQFLSAFARRDELAREVAKDTAAVMHALTSEIKVLTELVRSQKK